MARQNPQSKQADMPDALFQKYLALLEQEVAEELADEIVEGMQKKLGSGNLDEAEVKRALNDEIDKLLPKSEQSFDFARQRPGDGRPFTIALIGPTGVGKTTTVAKLAATFKLRDRLNVALLTIDTYRIAAVDQLRTYADIIGVPLMVANTPMETRQALQRCEGYDAVIIDTAGRSQRDDEKLDQLKSFIDAADPHEVHLVLSLTSRQEVMLEIAERFSRIRTDKLIFTKLDEAVNFGVVLNVIRRVNKQLSYITTGQEVPHHIEVGRPSRLAGLIVEGKLQ
jgi:flagellar biosynthesis protein FlhF